MKYFIPLILALALAGASLTEVAAQPGARSLTRPSFNVDEDGDGIEDGRATRHRSGGRMGRMGKGRSLGLELTDEQRDALKATVGELKEAEASPTEISEAVLATLGELEVELPEGFEENLAVRTAQRQEAVAKREAVQAVVEGLGEDATREEIRAALEEAGIERPTKRGRGIGGRRGHGGFRGGFGPPAANGAPADAGSSE